MAWAQSAGCVCHLVIQRPEFIHSEEDKVTDQRSNNENIIRTGTKERIPLNFKSLPQWRYPQRLSGVHLSSLFFPDDQVFVRV